MNKGQFTRELMCLVGDHDLEVKIEHTGFMFSVRMIEEVDRIRNDGTGNHEKVVLIHVE